MQKTARFSATHLLVALLFSMAAAPASAQSHPEYIPLGGGVKAVLYRPDSNPSPHVGVIIIHRTANYLQHQGCTQLSQRGFMVLCMNSRFDNNEALVNWELIALDVKRGVDYLRNTQHMNKVIFFGHSGGGPTTTFYQAVAERSEEHTSELQSQSNLVCRLLLGKKNIYRAKLARCNDSVPAYYVRHQAAHLLLVSNVIACQFSVRPGKLGSAHLHVALIELLWV